MVKDEDGNSVEDSVSVSIYAKVRSDDDGTVKPVTGKEKSDGFNDLFFVIILILILISIILYFYFGKTWKKKK